MLLTLKFLTYTLTRKYSIMQEMFILAFGKRTFLAFSKKILTSPKKCLFIYFEGNYLAVYRIYCF